MMTFSSRRGRAAFALAAALLLAGASVAEARAGRGGSFGNRGSRTFEQAPATRTAPAPAQPLPRTQQQPGPVNPNQGLRQPGQPGALAQPARSRFGGGFFAGLLGAGLLGALLGAGFFGGLGSFAAILGLLLQVALIVGLVMLAVRFFRSRRQPAYAGAHERSATGPTGAPNHQPMGGAGPQPMGGLGARGMAGAAPRTPGRTDMVGIGAADYDAYEQLLVNVQAAYSREDVAALRRLATPEMVSHFTEQFLETAREPTRTEVHDVRLLQGDLAEAWRDQDAEYATVAIRFAFDERRVDRTTGQTVPGGAGLGEATELWTFRRVPGAPWQLSAIQQA